MHRLAQIQEFADPTGEKPASFEDLEVVFNNAVTTILGLAGIVLFIMLIMGGFQYMTAGGEPPKIEAAKKTLTWAIGGLIFIALAFLFLRFIEVFTGAPVTQFQITQ